MEKIVIIGAGEFQNPLILKAKEMGYETHVFAWKAGDIGESSADYFYPISIVEKEEILRICKDIKPKAIVSIGSDLATITVNYVARGLGLICNSPQNDYCSTNKYLMRQALKKHNLDTPQFMCVDEEQDLEQLKSKFKYPVIVKPTDRSGSRGVTKVNNDLELMDAIPRAIKESFEKKAIIEDMIEGEEYSCECISFEGNHRCLAFTKKYTTDAPYFIETGHIQPGGIPEILQEEIKTEIFKALDALEIKYGASHSEFRLDKDGKMKIIEIGARMGGDCIGSDLVPISTGNDFVKMVIDTALGKRPYIKNTRNKVAAIRFIFSEEDKILLEQLLKEQDVVCVRKEVKQITNKRVTDSSTRYGFYIFECDERKTAEKIMSLR